MGKMSPTLLVASMLLMLSPMSAAFSLHCNSLHGINRPAFSVTPQNKMPLPLLLPAGSASSSKMLPSSSASFARNAATKKAHYSALRASDDAAADASMATTAGSGVDAGELAKIAGRIGTTTWLSWWAQVILSVVSMVTLFFANSVKGAAQGNIVTNGIFLAGIGLALSFVNVFWTWGYSQSGKKLSTTEDQKGSFVKLARTLKVGVIIALSGMLVTLFGAEQIVGMLVAKSISGNVVLSAQTVQMQLQALDILVVQANTNTMLSHLASLCNSLYITTLIPKDK
eukprot:CAMPEP_0181323974 /NCGR_PEP_ID=MMETSP1101-20121128/20089_1 /TAXON_ID=46948 /ORGANISM="Rhodomonas abbreviata, Strain Caron Lab Isolate" /LENGTH=283 /DNA_ID=CAMNT_0023432073 /DNA_START=28 /DNA_END=879 /DNA_ORIENTATION=+